jgi:hypothetical protein
MSESHAVETRLTLQGDSSVVVSGVSFDDCMIGIGVEGAIVFTGSRETQRR